MSADKTAKADDASQLLRLSEQLAQAESLRLARQLDKAESLCAALLRQHPHCFGAHYTLGLIHADRDDSLKALPHLLRAVMRGPHNAVASIALAGVLVESDALDLASQILDLAAQAAPDEPSLLVTRGEIHHRRGDYADAATCFRRALAADPAFVEAAIGLARAHYALGDFQEGALVLEEAIGRGHVTVDALFTLSQAPDRFITHDLAHAADVAQKLVAPTDVNGFACLDFVRAGALHRAGDHARAWTKACDANKRIFNLRKGQTQAVAQQYQDSLNQLSRQGALKPRQDPGRPVSLFLMGPSRSGKTSLERLVSRLGPVQRHYERSLVTDATRWTYQAAGMADVFGLPTLPPLLRDSLCEKYFHLLADDGSAGRLHTFTNPSDILQLPGLIRHVPNIRVVGIKRDHDDLALRIFMSHYNTANSYAYDLKSIYEHLESYDRLMDALAAAAPDVVRLVAYDDMVGDPRAAVDMVAGLCGLPLDATAALDIGDDRRCAAPYADLMRRA